MASQPPEKQLWAHCRPSLLKYVAHGSDAHPDCADVDTCKTLELRFFSPPLLGKEHTRLEDNTVVGSDEGCG